MTSQEDILRAYLKKLHLPPEIADIYFALHLYGPQTISQLARQSGIERTHIYRLTPELQQSRLIEVETAHKRSIYTAAPLDNLRALIEEKETELKKLQAELTAFSQTFSATSFAMPTTKVQFYQGVEGSKQTLWNQTRRKGEVCAILHENIQFHTQEAFFERWVRRCNERKLSGRGIVSDHYISTQQAWYSSHQNERLQYWQSRYVSPEIFSVDHSTVVYDDVVCHYIWKDKDIFSIEIYNQEIASAQRQYFELLWVQTKPLQVKLQGELSAP